MTLSITSPAFKNGSSIPADIYLHQQEYLTGSGVERPAVGDKIICAHHGRSRCARRHLGALGDL